MKIARSPSIGRDDRGVAQVEFLIAFISIFVLFLGFIQLALLAVGSLVVQHAAVRAARTAAVVLDDDPVHYGNAERRNLLADGTADLAWEQRLAEQVGNTDDAAQPDPMPRHLGYGGVRMAAIGRAAFAVLAAIAPAPGRVFEWLGQEHASVAGALGTGFAGRALHGLTFHAPLTTAVTFPIAPGSTELRMGTLSPDAPVTVRVTHLFDCAVPISAALLCNTLAWNPDRGRLEWLDQAAEDRAAFDELRSAPGARDHSLLALARARFTILRAEATFPAQSAPYLYASQLPP